MACWLLLPLLLKTDFKNTILKAIHNAWNGFQLAVTWSKTDLKIQFESNYNTFLQGKFKQLRLSKPDTKIQNLFSNSQRIGVIITSWPVVKSDIIDNPKPVTQDSERHLRYRVVLDRYQKYKFWKQFTTLFHFWNS